MRIEERTNTVTFTTNLDSKDSVSSTLKFVRDNASRNVDDPHYIKTNKIQLIKLVREFASLVTSGDCDGGLRDSKNFIENKMKEMEVSY